MEWVLLWLGLAVAAGVIAAAKGRSGVGYFALGFLFPVIGILIAIGVPSLKAATPTAQPPQPPPSPPTAAVPPVPPPTLARLPSGDLSSDAYRIYLVRKYKIERNDALGKVIAHDRLFDDIDAALRFVDGLERGVDGFIWRLGRRVGWFDAAASMFYRSDQIDEIGSHIRPKAGAVGFPVFNEDLEGAIHRAETAALR